MEYSKHSYTGCILNLNGPPLINIIILVHIHVTFMLSDQQVTTISYSIKHITFVHYTLYVLSQSTELNMENYEVYVHSASEVLSQTLTTLSNGAFTF